LGWAKTDRRRARPLPAGAYRLFGYRVVKGEWMISTTGGRGEVTVRAGKTSELTVSSKIHINLRARRLERGQLRVQLGITNGQRMGLSLYKKAKRVPLRYVVLNGEGEELVAGALSYG
jgi:hypothetical protein